MIFSNIFDMYQPTTWLAIGIVSAMLIVLWNVKLVSRLWPNIVGTLMLLGAVKLYILINFTETYRNIGTPMGIVFLICCAVIAYATPSRAVPAEDETPAKPPSQPPS